MAGAVSLTRVGGREGVMWDDCSAHYQSYYHLNPVQKNIKFYKKVKN